MSALAIFLGGGIGALARFGISRWAAIHWGESFPVGTLLCNVTGCLAIGLIASLTGPDGRILAPPLFRQFLMIGLLGGYTTFSSFGLQTLELARGGEWLPAAMNCLFSFCLCLIGVWVGYAVGQWMNLTR